MKQIIRYVSNLYCRKEGMCMQINIALCDDDVAFLKNLSKQICNILKHHRFLCTIASFDSGQALLQQYQTDPHKFDLVFLDIDMPGINGKETAAQLRSYDEDFQLVFLSAMCDEVFHTFSYGISSFIPKHKIDDMLEKELLRLAKLCVKREKEVIICESKDENKKHKQIKLRVQDIMYIESVNRRVFVHFIDENHTPLELCTCGLENAKRMFLPLGFVETHRTCLVNIAYIYDLEEDFVVMDNKRRLPLTRRRANAVYEAMNKRITEVTSL